MSEHSISTPDPRAQRRAAERESALRRTATNRQNAQRSTGPRTAPGKAASSRNSFRHGHYSSQTVLEGEPMQDFEDLREDLLAEYQPVGHTESALLEEIAQCRWRILRFRRHEARIMDDSEKVYAEPALLFTINRLMAGAERAFYRALKELQRLQTMRQGTDDETTYTENGFVPQNYDFAQPPADTPALDTETTETEAQFVQPSALDSIQTPDEPVGPPAVS